MVNAYILRIVLMIHLMCISHFSYNTLSCCPCMLYVSMFNLFSYSVALLLESFLLKYLVSDTSTLEILSINPQTTVVSYS